LNKKAYEIYKSPVTGKTFVNLTQVNNGFPAKEPALVIGTSTSLVAGVLSLVAVLFPHLLSDHTTSIILVVATFLLPILTAIFTRGKVWSPASVLELVEKAIEEATSVANKPVNKDVPPKVL
jgi:hypothetical protein